MNESIEEWLTKVTCSDSKVWVENPETIKESGFMGKSYTTFRVLLKSSESELIAIRHRFSEFVLLRDILRVFFIFISHYFFSLLLYIIILFISLLFMLILLNYLIYFICL